MYIHIYRYTLEDVPANLKQVFYRLVEALESRPTRLRMCLQTCSRCTPTLSACCSSGLLLFTPTSLHAYCS